MQAHTYSTELGGRTLTLETGRIAKLVAGSVKLTYGETILLVTAQASNRPSSLDFLPLTVEFEERHYAIGKIPGSFQRRESRPGEKAILGARITDRQIRPLFPKGYRQETQVIITVLSADQENTPDILGPIAASSALMLSDIPWAGPCATVRVGYIDGQYQINPTVSQMADSLIDIVVAGTQEAVLMVEAGAKEVNEELMVGAIEFAHAQMQPLLEMQLQMQAALGKEKFEWTPVTKASKELVPELLEAARVAGLREAILVLGKKDRAKALSSLEQDLISARVPDPQAEGAAEKAGLLADAFNACIKEESRRLILEDNLRSDGRDPQTVRPIWAEAPDLPRAHGSAMFTRGETQVLGVTTLGTDRDGILIDDLSLETDDKFMLHYNFPPYSTGEVKRMGGQSRREIGHGVLAKRALRAVLPSYESFPYVIRIVGEVLESNGSSSMATVCAGCLSLMDAGVPISAPVAGVAMGLVMDAEGKNYKVLTDILGSEDALGDMDFKVCGTANGITALQMDIKILGITPAIMREALEQAKIGRLHILGKMAEALAQPRAEISLFAPRIISTKINPEKIGVVIGPGGKNIRELEAMGAQITIEQDGVVRIFSQDAVAAQKVLARIEMQTKEAKVGEVFEGKVVRIMPFGAFINLFGDVDGMLHISQMSEERISAVEDVLNLGDTVTVKIVKVDERGKFDLTRPELEGKVAARTDRPPRRDDGGRDGGGRDGGGRGR